MLGLLLCVQQYRRALCSYFPRNLRIQNLLWDFGAKSPSARGCWMMHMNSLWLKRVSSLWHGKSSNCLLQLSHRQNRKAPTERLMEPFRERLWPVAGSNVSCTFPCFRGLVKVRCVPKMGSLGFELTQSCVTEHINLSSDSSALSCSKEGKGAKSQEELPMLLTFPLLLAITHLEFSSSFSS